MQANDIAFTVPDTTPRPIVDASAHAHLTGTADALADLLMREPLRRQAGLTIDPATVKGQAEGDLALDLKLGRTARPEDTQFHASGSLANLQIEKFIGDEKLEQATATFQADRNTLKIVGDGDLLGAATHVEVARAPGEEGLATVTFALDAAARAKRGLNFGSWLTGPLPVKLKAPLTRASAEVEIDLTPAGVDNPVPGLSKPAGKAGKATFVVKPTPQGALLTNIAIDMGVPMLRGSAQMDNEGAVQSATITEARIAPGDDFKVDVVNGPTLLKASVRGASLDARAFVKSLWEGASSGQAMAKDFDLDARIATVLGANKQAMTGVELTAFRRGGETRLGSLRGRIGAGAVSATGSGGEMRLVTSDAGALLRFADLYPRLEGGDLHLLLRTQRELERRRGDDQRFRPARRTGVPPAGQRRARRAPQATAARPIDPSRIRFDKMTASFERTPGKLTIQDGVIYNPSMGLTAQGAIDFGHNQIDVSGSFVPAYTVNTMLTKIPLVGVLLSGGENDGVFGVSYRVHGALSGPTLTVNPLSAIAPGILRRILGAIDGTTSRGGAPDPVETSDAPRAPVGAVGYTARSSTCFLRPSESLTIPPVFSASRVMSASLVAERRVVDPQAPAADLAARFAGRGDEAGAHEGAERAKAGVELGPRHIDRRQALGELLLLESLARGGGGGLGRRAPVQERGRLVGQRLLRFVDLGALEAFEPADLVSGRSVNSLRNRPTSASSALRQNCQYS